MKIVIRPVVIVEGRYDKIKLESLLDATIIACGGFRIYKDGEKKSLIRQLAMQKGAIILTDSDRAGFQLRHYLHSILQGCEVKDLYIPDVIGKEKRKKTAAREGKLGVEGISAQVLQDLFSQFGKERQVKTAQIDTAMLYELGLTGTTQSAIRRRALQQKLNLPARMNLHMLVSILNERFEKSSFLEWYNINIETNKE